MLEPEGFYDAITTYGLPSSIIDLDRSAQDSVPYRVKTAYGLTDPFIVSGVTKQGGSLSPLKCTLTTSLCNRWLMDLDCQGALTVRTHQSRIGKVHTPADNLSLHVSMIEAMDDTLIMRCSLSALKFSARCTDRFQATYGWEMEWRKSTLYAFNTAPPQGEDALMPSVDYKNHPLSCHSRLPPCHPRLLPSAWSIASSTLFSLQLSIIPTDLSFILNGNVSLRHLHSQFHNLYPSFPAIPSRTLSNFENHGFTLLKHFGSFSSLTCFSSFPSFMPHLLQFPSHQYYLTQDWPLLTSWFAFIPLLLHHTCLPDPSILASPSHRKIIAENSILALSETLSHSSSYSHPSQHADLLATDGSMVSDPLTGRKSVTFAVAASGTVFSTSLPFKMLDAGILHGEVYAIVAASLLSLHRPNHPQPHIISDHLNSVNLLRSLPSPLRLVNHPAHALYRWVLDIWSRLPAAPTISHVRAHTNAHDIKSNLNRLVDHVASSSQHLPLPPPSVPVPSFFMDNFMTFSSSHGFIESSIFVYVDSLLAKAHAASLNSCHEPLPLLPLFDNTPPPTYPYTKSPSSYSAVIQLYARSGQLDTALLLSSRLNEGFQPWCRFGCQKIEDPHHIFVLCPNFTSLWRDYAQRLKSTTLAVLDTYHLPEQDISFIIE